MLNCVCKDHNQGMCVFLDEVWRRLHSQYPDSGVAFSTRHHFAIDDATRRG
jgi:hypothetical protein